MPGYLAKPLQSNLHHSCRPAARLNQKVMSRQRDKLSQHYGCVLERDSNIGSIHLMLLKEVHLVLPSTQDIQDWRQSSVPEAPPQTTSLPPDKRERLWPILGCGRSGMEQVSEAGGRGNSSMSEVYVSSTKPPTSICPGDF